MILLIFSLTLTERNEMKQNEGRMAWNEVFMKFVIFE